MSQASKEGLRGPDNQLNPEISRTLEKHPTQWKQRSSSRGLRKWHRSPSCAYNTLVACWNTPATHPELQEGQQQVPQGPAGSCGASKGEVRLRAQRDPMPLYIRRKTCCCGSCTGCFY